MLAFGRAARRLASTIVGFGANDNGQLDLPRSVLCGPSAGRGPLQTRLACGLYHSTHCDDAGLVSVAGWFHRPKLASQTPWTSVQLPTREAPASVAAGRAHSVVVDASGAAFHLQHSLAGETTVQRVALGEAVVRAACGLDHSLLVTCAGAVWAYGRATDGQLGAAVRGLAVPCTAPVRVALPGPARRVWAGGDFSLALLADGSAWLWGNGEYGQALTGAPVFAQREPLRSEQLSQAGVRMCALGTHHGVVAGSDGALLVWGWGAAGPARVVADRAVAPALALGGRVLALAAGAGASYALVRGRGLVTWGAAAPDAAPAVLRPAADAVADVIAGPLHGFALCGEPGA